MKKCGVTQLLRGNTRCDFTVSAILYLANQLSIQTTPSRSFRLVATIPELARKMMVTKDNIHRACLDLMEAKIKALQKALDDLSAGADSESKSTAGDKHETGRAMVQIEQARLGKQLSELVLQQNALRSINPDLTVDRVMNGSLVRVAQGMFYLSVALGKIEVAGESVMTLSTASPLGTCWLGARCGETVTFKGTDYTFLEII